MYNVALCAQSLNSLLDSTCDSRCAVINAETGSGKTLCVFILVTLNYCILLKDYYNIMQYIAKAQARINSKPMEYQFSSHSGSCVEHTSVYALSLPMCDQRENS